jgi:hypothetical protein
MLDTVTRRLPSGCSSQYGYLLLATHLIARVANCWIRQPVQEGWVASYQQSWVATYCRGMGHNYLLRCAASFVHRLLAN